MKKINIELNCNQGELRQITEKEYPHVYLNHEISDNDLNTALDVIITAFMQRGLYRMTVDLEERNRSMMPTEEMTLKEIEEKLGCKVKIVNEKEEII